MQIGRIEEIMTGLGFSSYESRAYAALVGENPLTGYELSGKSGIPRSKIYECIERLKRKGLVLPVEGNPVKYVPVPPDEFARRLSNEFESSIQTLESLLAEDIQTPAIDYIFNISGYEEIIGKASEMIRDANTYLDLSIWDNEVEYLMDDVLLAKDSGVQIRVIVFGNSLQNFKEIYRHRPLSENEFEGRWITVLKDNSEVLTGECSDTYGSIAAWTRNRSLVHTSMKYIEHEILRIQESSKEKNAE
ncbi:MAG: TrmB family transcriptional regulator [Candidatus Latescibacteria bacterium]|nr:TrmB family transcriptional regulator [Candidatus Latescibacterota bacterium]